MGLTQKLGTIPLAILTDTSNNVGIGGSPSGSYKLEVTGTAKVSGAATFSSSVTATQLNATTTTAGYAAILTNTNGASDSNGLLVKAGSGSTEYNVRFANQTDTTTFFTIKGNGRVGIGTSTPPDKFVISNNGAEGIEFGFDTGVPYLFAYNRSTLAYKPIAFVGNTNVLIGTITDTGDAKLQVNGAVEVIGAFNSTAASTGGIDYSGGTRFFSTGASGSTKGTFTWIAKGADNSSSTPMTITSGGDVLVNTTSTSSGAKFNVFFSDNTNNGAVLRETTGNASVGYLIFNSNGSQTGSITRIGSTNAVAYNTTSDYRLKEDFKEINGLEKISAIKVYDFKWKDNEARMDGVIAHELQEILPYAVYGKKDALEKDGSIKAQAVDYSKIVPTLVKAIQELSQQNQELNDRLTKAGL